MAARAGTVRRCWLELDESRRGLPRTVGRPRAGGRVRIGGGGLAQPVFRAHAQGVGGGGGGMVCHHADGELEMARKGVEAERESGELGP